MNSTQRQLIDYYITQIDRHLVANHTATDPPLQSLSELRQKLGDMLDRALDTPPFGEADGSIGPREWMRASRILEGLDHLLGAVNDWRRPR